MFSLLIHCYNVKNIKKALYWDLCKPSVFGPLLVVMATVDEPDLISSALMIGFVMIQNDS